MLHLGAAQRERRRVITRRGLWQRPGKKAALSMWREVGLQVPLWQLQAVSLTRRRRHPRIGRPAAPPPAGAGGAARRARRGGIVSLTPVMARIERRLQRL